MRKLLFLALFAITVLSQPVRAQEDNRKDEEIAKKVNTLLFQMTLKEKIAQLTQDAPRNERLDIPVMMHSEGLHGLWNKGATVYPQALALGGTWQPSLVREMAEHIAKEARAANISHIYSPNLDVSVGDPRYGRVEESYGEDPYLVSRMGVAYIKGLQGTGAERLDKNHVLATGKHFVGYSENRRGINGAFVDMSQRRLHEIHLPPFEAAVKEAKVGVIMPGHQDLNGIPMHANGKLINGLLRDKWGFDGFVVSDNSDISRLETMHHIAKKRTEAAVMGLKAGVDMDLVLGKDPKNSAYLYSILKDTLQKDPSLMKYINQSTARILTAKYKLGLFDINQQSFLDSVISKPESQELALKIAQKAVTLLKNDNNLLPLDKEKVQSIAVIGPNATEIPRGNGRYPPQLGGYSGVPPYYTSILEGIKDKVGSNVKVNYAQGCKLMCDSKAGFPEAIKAAKNSDVVILAVGGSTRTGGEGKDRADLDLYGAQKELVKAIHKTGKPIIAVLLNGRPLSINYIVENIPSVIEGWFLGMRTGEALADVIFGDYNPGGKLTVTFPRSVGQLPVTYLQKPDFVGSGEGQYRFEDKSPLFPFGHGLSYTTFEYSNLELGRSEIEKTGNTTVSVDVTNTGDRAGEEVVQMYVRDDVASVGRYNKMLKGFERIHLEPGQTKSVQFQVNFEDLYLYDRNMERVVEPGDFTISIGGSSMEKDLKAVELTVE